MVLPIAAIIGAIGGLANAGVGYASAKANQRAGAGAANRANAARKKGIKLARKGLKFAKKGVKKEEAAIGEGKEKLTQQDTILGDLIQLLTGARSDAYGNTTRYDKGLGRWTTDLTDRTRRIMSGEELAFMRDQMRAAQADEDYAQVRNKLLTGGGSQAGSTADLTELLALRGGEASDRSKNIVAKQALRMNQGGIIPYLMRTANEQSGQTLADTLLAGRAAGRSEYQDEEGFRVNNLLKQLQGFGGTAASSPESGYNTAISGRQDAAAKGLTSGVETVSDTYGKQADWLRKAYPDYSGVINALSGIGGAITGTAVQAPPPLDLSWLKSAISTGTNLAGAFAPGGTSTVAKDQGRLV